MIHYGYIIDKNTITQKGKVQGLSYKVNAKGTKWIVYHESLSISFIKLLDTLRLNT